MTDAAPPLKNPEREKVRTTYAACVPIVRIKSQDLFQQARVIEIEHEGRIYRLRLTQLNKLILNA